MLSQLIFSWFLVFGWFQFSNAHDSAFSQNSKDEIPLFSKTEACKDSIYPIEPSSFASQNSNLKRVLSTTIQQCPSDQSTTSDSSGCISCGSLCAHCEDFTQACLVCQDPNKMEIDPIDKTQCKCKGTQTLGTNGCECSTNEWYDGSTCQSCPSGQFYDKTSCSPCTAKKFIVKSNIKVKESPSCCADNKFYNSNHKCQPCPENCNFCEKITGACIQCNTKIKLKNIFAGPKKTSCCSTPGQFFNKDTKKCTSCPDSNCKYCQDGDGTCISCSGLMRSGTLIVDFKKTSCCADKNKYYSENNACEICPDKNCAQCEDTSGNCIKCNKNLKGSTSVNVQVCCDPGNYYKPTKNCQPCPDPNCALCENVTGKCFECSQKIKIKTLAGTKKLPSCCPEKQYFEESQKKCLDCSSNCDWCEDVSGNCLQCSSSLKIKSVTVKMKKTSCCNDRKYWDDTNKQCESCFGSCASCEDVTGLCICSKTIAIKTKASMKPTNCCKIGEYWENNVCGACQDKCIECEDISGDCLRCEEDFHVTTTVFSSTGSCCPDGFYYEDGKCNECIKPCATCSSATKCESCTDVATYDKKNSACICNSGFFNTATGCQRCLAPCNICSNANTCSSCRNHATLNNKSCLCDSGYTLNSTSTYGYCTANCNILCTECDIDDGNKCSECITNAELSGTKCSCTANAYYDMNSQTCICNSGYTLAYNKCVGCKKYLSSNEIKSAIFSSTWTSLSIYFNVKIDTGIDPDCDKVFDSTTVGLFGKSPVCSWADKKTLKIALGSMFKLRSQTIYLDGTYLIKDTSDPCTIKYQPLSIVPSSTSSPAPTAVLTGPSTISLSCGSDPLTYSGEKSTMSIGYMTYTWSSSISPPNIQASDFIKAQKSSSILIPRSLFSSSATLNLTLTVTNYLGLKSAAWLITTITGESSLSVVFDQGASISIKASSSVTIKAKLSSLCANSASSSFSWSWKYISGPTINSASILQNANNDKLTISKNSLAATNNSPYVFMAVASQVYNGATISGNATISITVTSSPLIIQLSKTSGDVSPDSDFIVNASGSKDPDDVSGSLAYLWTCLNTEDDSKCVGNDGKSLLDNEIGVILMISSSRLVKGAQWSITCTISKDVRISSSTISLNVLTENATAKAEISMKWEKFNPQGINKFSASVTSSYSSTLSWAVTSGQDVSISPNYLSTISLPSGTLTEGSSYTFTLSISAEGKTFNVHLPVYSNLGATCTGTASVNPTTGNALTTLFKLSVDGCYDRDEEDYPLAYKYLDSTDGKTYTLGYTTEINYLSTYLFPNENTIIIRVCDSLSTCSDYSVILNISPANSRLLESSSLMDAYLENTIDTDNIPSAISLFCVSATIGSDLFFKMWSDLQSYVTNNEMTSDLLQNTLGAAYSMTTQTAQMSAKMFTTMAAWLGNIISSNPSLIPSQENMVTVVALVDNYLSYGHSTNYIEMALEDYLINADKFLTYWEIAATLDDLVTQSAMDGSQNTDMTKVFKYRDFPTGMANHTARIGTNQTFSVPESLSYADTDIMNLKLHYYNISGELSDIVMISFANSGSYINYALETAAETYVPFSTSDWPFALELPIGQNLGKHYSWSCMFYNETSKTWLEEGCAVAEIKNSSIVFEVYHFSMFKLTQTEVSPPINASGSSCDYNFAPLYIMAVTLFFSIIFVPVLSLLDNRDSKRKLLPGVKEIEIRQDSDHFIDKTELDAGEKSKVKVLDNPSYDFESFRNEIMESSISRDEKAPKPLNSETPRVFTKVISPEHESSDLALPKNLEGIAEKAENNETELQILLEGHLLFGLLYFRQRLSRTARLFILVIVILLELFLEGLLLYGFENTGKGKSASTETLFNDYEAVYFGYTMLALGITVPAEFFFIAAFGIDRRKAPFWNIAGIALGILIAAGSIVGIVLLDMELCFEWSGYWAISFLYGILVQVFVIETVYMIGRYVSIQLFK